MVTLGPILAIKKRIFLIDLHEYYPLNSIHLILLNS